MIVYLNQSIVWLYQQNTTKYQVEDSVLNIDSVIEQNIKASKDKPLRGSSYIKLPIELNHSR